MDVGNLLKLKDGEGSMIPKRARILFKYMMKMDPDGVHQCQRLVSWLDHQGKVKSYYRALDREVYHLARELGAEIVYCVETDSQVARLPENTCAVAECEEPGVYKDPDWGRLCRRHGMTVRSRRKRGRKDPKAPLIGRRPRKTPKRNRELWTIIRAHVSREEWDDMWTWAEGRSTLLPPTFVSDILGRTVYHLEEEE